MTTLRNLKRDMLLLVFLSACLLNIGTAQAQINQPPLLKPTILAPPAQNAGFSEIVWLLQRIILQYQPAAKTDLREEDNRLIFHYTRVPQFPTHIADNSGNLSQAPANAFGPDFDEFLLYVYKREDVLSDLPPTPQKETPQGFGTAFTARYNLRTTSQTANDALEIDVPSYKYKWPYEAMEKLFREKLIEEFYPCRGTCLGTTRYVFAVAVAHLLIDIQRAQKQKDQPVQIGPRGPNATLEPQLSPQQFVEIAEKPENQKLIETLTTEFAPELVQLGVFPKDTKITAKRYEYFTVQFSYGKGVTPTMVDKIKTLLAGYSEASLKLASAEKGY